MGTAQQEPPATAQRAESALFLLVEGNLGELIGHIRGIRLDLVARLPVGHRSLRVVGGMRIVDDGSLLVAKVLRGPQIVEPCRVVGHGRFLPRVGASRIARGSGLGRGA